MSRDKRYSRTSLESGGTATNSTLNSATTSLSGSRRSDRYSVDSKNRHHPLGGFSLSDDEIEGRRKLLLRLGIASCPAWFLAIGTGWGAYYYGGIVALAAVFTSCLQIEHTRSKKDLLNSNCCIGARSTFSTLRTFHIIISILSFIGVIVDLALIILLTNGKHKSFSEQDDKGLRVTLCAVNMLSMISISLLSFMSARKVMMIHEWVNFKLSSKISRGSASLDEIIELKKEMRQERRRNSSNSENERNQHGSGSATAADANEASTDRHVPGKNEPKAQTCCDQEDDDCQEDFEGSTVQIVPDDSAATEIVVADHHYAINMTTLSSSSAAARDDDDGVSYHHQWEPSVDHQDGHSRSSSAFFGYSNHHVQPVEGPFSPLK